MTNKEQILQTALELFAEQGYDRTPTSQIARAAGVSEGLIFRHYTNKAGLLKAIIDTGLEQVAQTMESYDTEPDPWQAILTHIKRSLEWIRVHQTFWRFVQKVRFQAAVLEVAGSQIEAGNRQIVSQLTENFKEAGAARPLEEALALFALIDGITIHYLQDPEHYPLEQMQTYLLQRYNHETRLD